MTTPENAIEEALKAARKEWLLDQMMTLQGMKVVNNGRPDTDLTWPHYDFGYRAGTNSTLQTIIDRYQSELNNQ